MLDAHPDLAIPPETGFLARIPPPSEATAAGPDALADVMTRHTPEAPNWPDFGLSERAVRARLAAIHPFDATEGIRTFYRMYAEARDATRWGDKTPSYCFHVSHVEALVPEARFVHIVRDGRDVAVSLRRRWFSPGHDIEVQAEHWRRHVEAARDGCASTRHHVEVRYEDLVRSPEATLRPVCELLELDLHPAMLRYHDHTRDRLREHGTRVDVSGRVVVSGEQRFEQQRKTTVPPDPTQIGVWRRHLTAEDADRFAAAAGDLLGYVDR